MYIKAVSGTHGLMIANSPLSQAKRLKFLKNIDESSSTNIPKTTNVGKTNLKDNGQQIPLKHMRVDLSSLPADPGQRPRVKDQNGLHGRCWMEEGPCQPRNHFFKRREIGGRVRKFNPSWFDDHKYWLEYNIEPEAAFCLCCYIFKSKIKSKGGADNFVKGGFKAWNKRERLDLPNNGGPHNLAVQKCQNLMNWAQSIVMDIYKQIYLTKDKNWTKIYVSIDCSYYIKDCLSGVIMKVVTHETKISMLNKMIKWVMLC
ncbi:LOW QUALITY PROTEIN: hypothetical protein OSB04_012674 [Centaurea solstitialis]|uniref:TTF-type domain-containing protein n=1 Tax=Centaurea solstitialis TaxID=347529 RepID=A0AA38TBS9_9ASTR|nr:LOW QUALITY PROTEIN: hypothetical protein OSB04_012674 [Centaurea solstitialis]